MIVTGDRAHARGIFVATHGLRFGILCPGSTLPAWQAQCIRALVASGEAELRLVILGSLESRGYSAKRSRSSIAAGLLRLYQRLWVERRCHALRRVDLADEFTGVAQLNVRRWPGPDNAAAGVIEEIAEHKLDFIVDFVGLGLADDGLLGVTRFGVWFYRHGEACRDEPPYLRDVIKRRMVSRATLMAAVSDSSEPVTLFEGHFRTRESYVTQIDTCCFASAKWCAVACARLRLGQIPPRRSAPATRDAEEIERLSSLRFLDFLARQPIRFLASILRKLFFLDQWSVALVHGGAEDLIRAQSSCRFDWLKTTSLRDFYADPFGLSVDGVVHVLVEVFDYVHGRGRIAQVDFRNTIKRQCLPVGIDSGSHMSYPYIILFNGEILCVPETSMAGDVRLYRAVEFPGRWELAATLIEGFPAVDSTIFEYSGMWWLLCGRRGALSEVELYAWYASSPWGPWTPHALNPIKCDVRSSRPAGPPFMIADSFCRPAQDCSRTYGGAVAVNRIVKLTPTAFEEELVARLEPEPSGPYPHGMHTICPIGCLTLVDGKRTRFHIAAPALKVWAAVAGRRRGATGADRR